MTNETKNKPVHTLRDGLLKVSIWYNRTEQGPKYSFDLIRSYTDREQKWQNTRNLNRRDVLRAARLLEKAYDFVTDLYEQETSDGGES